MPLHGTRGAASALGFGFAGASGPSGPLVIGVEYTFTPYGQVGPIGPSQSQANSYWSGKPEILAALTVTNGVNIIGLGAGTYTVDMLGASGGAASNSPTQRSYFTDYGSANVYGGVGARIQATFTLTAFTTVYIFVGQQGTTGQYTTGGGSSFSGSGGGASGIYIDSSTPIAIAGGGGGTGGSYNETAYNSQQRMWDASATATSNALGPLSSSSPTSVYDPTAPSGGIDGFSGGAWNGTLNTGTGSTLGFGKALNSGSPNGGYVPVGSPSTRPDARVPYTETTVTGVTGNVQSWGGFGGGGAGYGNFGSGGGGGGWSSGPGFNKDANTSGALRAGGGGGGSYTNTAYLSSITVTGGSSLSISPYYGDGYFKITKTA